MSPLETISFRSCDLTATEIRLIRDMDAIEFLVPVIPMNGDMDWLLWLILAGGVLAGITTQFSSEPQIGAKFERVGGFTSMF